MAQAFVVYSRPGCHLCEELIEALLPMIRGKAQLTVRDIDGDDGLMRRYGTRIPVVEWHGRVLCEFRLDKDAIARALSDAG